MQKDERDDKMIRRDIGEEQWKGIEKTAEVELLEIKKGIKSLVGKRQEYTLLCLDA